MEDTFKFGSDISAPVERENTPIENAHDMAGYLCDHIQLPDEYSTQDILAEARALSALLHQTVIKEDESKRLEQSLTDTLEEQFLDSADNDMIATYYTVKDLTGEKLDLTTRVKLAKYILEVNAEPATNEAFNDFMYVEKENDDE